MTRNKLSYHWAIVAAVFLMYAATIGVVVNTFSVFGPAMMKDLGISASSLQLSNFCGSMVGLVTGIYIGRIMKKLGIRLVMPVFSLIMCAGFAMRAMVNSLPGLIACGVIISFGMTGVSTIPGGMLINNWFTEKKGLASGIAFSGSVVGGLILVQLSNFLLIQLGWRTAILIVAAIAALILMPVTLFIVRENPQDKGLVPLGSENGAAQSSAAITGIRAKAYYKTASFYLLAFTGFAINLCGMGTLNNLTICLQSEYGHSASITANVYSVCMAVQIGGKFLLGAIYDKKGLRFGSFYNLFFYLLTTVLFMFSANVPVALLLGAVYGISSSMTTVTLPYLCALVVGRRNYSDIYGIISVFYGLGGALGPVFASAVFDITGSFTPAWLIFAACNIVLAFTGIAAHKKAKGFAELSD